MRIYRVARLVLLFLAVVPRLAVAQPTSIVADEAAFRWWPRSGPVQTPPKLAMGLFDAGPSFRLRNYFGTDTVLYGRRAAWSLPGGALYGLGIYQVHTRLFLPESLQPIGRYDTRIAFRYGGAYLGRRSDNEFVAWEVGFFVGGGGVGYKQSLVPRALQRSADVFAVLETEASLQLGNWGQLWFRITASYQDFFALREQGIPLGKLRGPSLTVAAGLRL